MPLPKTLRILALLPLLGMTGCIAGTIHVVGRATGLKPPRWDGGVQVVTEPPGQLCVAERDGTVLGHVASTPGRLQIERSIHPYQLRCSSEQAQETVTTFRPESDPGAFVPLPTGPVGIAMLTAATISGSLNRFPPEVSIASPPARFASAAERDAWFAARAQAIATTFTEQERRARQPCAYDSDSTVCLANLEDVARRRGDAETTLAQLRAGARLASDPVLAEVAER